MAQPTKPKGGNDYSKINMLPPVSGEKPNPRKVAIKKDNQKDYQKKGYKYLGPKTPDMNNLEDLKGTKKLKKIKKTKPIIKNEKPIKTETIDFISNIKWKNMKLKDIYRVIKEDEKRKKEILLDDFDNEVCENCGEAIHEGDCNECNEEEEIEEQNTVSAIGGYNAPLSIKKKMIFPTSRK